MIKDRSEFDEEFVRLALALDEHMPGYIDSYFGPEQWAQEAKQAGKLPLPELTDRADQLAIQVSEADGLGEQRRDFLARQITAMQMSLRLLTGENVSLTEEVQALYDVQPAWKDESIFEDAYKRLDQILPGEGSLKERLENWNKSLEISIEKLKELLPIATDRLRELTDKKFNLPESESFSVEFVSDQPWRAYNWYLGQYQSRIDINADLPPRVNEVAEFIAHEGYPGHHTELCLKESKLVTQMNYREHLVTLINSPSCVVSEGIATTALETILMDEELEDWYRKELLPRAGMTHIDVTVMMEVSRAERRLESFAGNAAFMQHDQNKSLQDIISYAQKYGLSTEKEANHLIRFISDPLARSYIFTYFIGRDLLEELFKHGDRDQYFARLLQEPVTPSQVREWIKN
jgi:hypothetical protein